MVLLSRKAFPQRFVRPLALCAAALLPTEAEAVDCNWRGPPFHLTSAGPWPRATTLKSGQQCSARLRNFGRNVLRFRNIELYEAPKNGKVRLHENTRVSYVSRDGFEGLDQFTLRICGQENGVDGCTMIQYSVTVQGR